MIDHQVHDQLHVTIMAAFDNHIHVCDGPKRWIDVFVIGYIISHIYLRGFVDRAELYFA
jgi:hypothetical protein